MRRGQSGRAASGGREQWSSAAVREPIKHSDTATSDQRAHSAVHAAVGPVVAARAARVECLFNGSRRRGRKRAATPSNANTNARSGPSKMDSTRGGGYSARSKRGSGCRVIEARRSAARSESRGVGQCMRACNNPDSVRVNPMSFSSFLKGACGHALPPEERRARGERRRSRDRGVEWSC